MSLAQRIQEAWQTQAKWLVVLRPLAWLYRGGFLLNQKMYQLGIKRAYRAPVPVMVIGNITVGGSGKTPLLIHLVNHLQAHQVRVGVISRGYGGQGPFPALVEQDAMPKQVGDEPCLIVQATQAPMAVGPNRQKSIELLLSRYDLDLIISDDGLQHVALARDLEWIVLDQNRGLGNEKILPEGYLREPKSRLEHATVIEHSQQPTRDMHMHLQATAPYLLHGRDELFDPKENFYAVVGIGFPQRFYQTLEKMGIVHFQCHEFPDHHEYEWDDLQFDDQQPIITTEKDAVKLLPLLQQQPDFKNSIWVVPVEATLSETCYSTLAAQLKLLGVHLKG